MPFLLALIVNSLLFGVHSAIATVQNQHPKSHGCDVLADVFPDKVFHVGSPVYAYENQEFWSNTEILSPNCVFRPTCARDVAEGIALLGKVRGKFAFRGGGHMGIKVPQYTSVQSCRNLLAFSRAPTASMMEY